MDAKDNVNTSLLFTLIALFIFLFQTHLYFFFIFLAIAQTLKNKETFPLALSTCRALNTSLGVPQRPIKDAVWLSLTKQTQRKWKAESLGKGKYKNPNSVPTSLRNTNKKLIIVYCVLSTCVI